MAQPHQQQPPSTASPSQIPVPVIPPPPPTPTPTPARHSASASAATTTATRRASTSIHPASPARSRISTPSTSVASASSNAPPTITPTTTTATTAPPPPTSSAQLTAAQALAQQPTTTAHHTPSLFGGPSLFGSVLPQNQELNRAYGAVLPLNNNNPSTRILSSANISTPVPSSASSSATFLTGRSQPPPQSIHAAATAAGAGRTASPFIRHNTTGSNTPSRIGQGSNITLMPGVPLPLSFNSTTGSPRIHSAQHHTGIYTAPHFYTSAVGAAATAAAVSAASAGSAAGGGGPSTMGSRGSPTPRNMNMPGGAYPQAGGGIPTSPPSGLSGFPAWYRHPTSGLLPLLEVPSALLSAGSATATRSAPRTGTGSTSALLRSSAGLALHAGRPPSSSTNTTGATTTTQVPNPLHAGPIAGGAMAEDTLVSFSWVIGELALLRDEVERTMPPGDEGRSVSAGAGRNPVWTTQPCFGDPKLPKWKLELVRTQRNRTTSDEDYHPLDENVPSTSSTSSDAQQTPLHAQQDARSESGDSDDTPRPDATTVLSVYLTSLALEYLPSDALIPATIMLGLQPARTTLSRLQSRQGAWLWQTHSSFVFRREHEFFECHSLPSLSELLEMEEVRAQDALRLVVQIGCGPGIVGPETEGGDGFGFGFGGGVGLGAEGRGGEMLPMPRLAPFQMPSAHYVSQTILDAMEGLVDCARTGDVRIIVRERGLLIRPPAVGVGAGAATRSDDGHFEEGQGGQQAYVIPYPVGSYFPLDVAESAEQQAMAAAAAMEHSGVLPEDATTPTASVVVRDRIIWAHSSVLRARSQYFADMMDGGFAEAQDELDNDLHAHATSDPGTSRAIKTFRIPDSEWATVYWLIRYLYLEEIEFAEREDVRSAALDNEWQICAEGLYPEEGGGRGGQTRPNWEWRTISELLREEEEEDGDGGGEVGLGPEAQMHYSNTNTNVTSVDRAATGVPSSSSGTKLAVPSSPSSSWRGHPGTIYSSSHPPPKNLEAQAQCHGQTSSSSSSSAGSSTLSSTHSEQHRLSVSSAASMHVGHDAFVAQSQPGGSGSGSVGAGGEGGPGMSSASTTPVPHHHHEQHHQQYPQSNIIRHASTMNDPHEHPAARAPPASALATYKLAHRYGQVGLAELAKVHIVETLSPQSAFPVLLATALYSGLHEAIKRYVYEHWDEVSHTEEFERCCDEVGAGEWGAEAGRSLRIFMQSLLSPARILLASPQR